MSKQKKHYDSVESMPEGLRRYTEKLIEQSTVINSSINTFTSALHGQLIIDRMEDEPKVNNAMSTLAKMITSTVINNAVSAHWCSFFQELADGQKPEALADIQQTVTASLIQSFNQQISNYAPVSIIGKITAKRLKSSNYAPSHVFSENDYKTIETTPLEEAKRSARRFIDNQRGVRIDWKDSKGKNHTYVSIPEQIDGMEEWQVDSLCYRFTMENKTDEDGRLIDYCDMSLNEYFASALHDCMMIGTITERDYSMIKMVLNGFSYEDIASAKECSKQYVGKRMLKAYRALNDYIMTEQDYILGDRPAEVEKMVEKYTAEIMKL